ncbi:hypothetical protein [Pedobacter cryophilus]|uniref:Uncharacterized protein n=1 Tax=Pedobacter cryophilus TaxID=2571271 RepID=A0A4U1BZ16_9SPHI|nr:hypothetical protein [Pedobacter cryophilus]TKB95747.1 hypothetical protein FA046_15765 [Pedobacter cryophilus]
MKRKFLICLLIAGIHNCFAQGAKETVKDYLIPESSFNNATFYGVFKTSPFYRNNRSIYYIDKGNYFDITDAQLYEGEPTAISTLSVSTSSTEVKMFKSILTNPFTTNKVTNYSNPVILLKLPINNLPVKWTSKTIAGDLEYCSAIFSSITYKEKTYKAIKVTKTSPDTKIKTIEYYAKGIGLYEVSFLDPSTGKTQLIHSLLKLNFE